MNKQILFIILSFFLTSCSTVELATLEVGEKAIEIEEEKIKQEK